MPSISQIEEKHSPFGVDDVVVSGISCRFPESDNMAEFQANLLNGVDMVTENDRRWEPGLFGLPRRSATIKELRKFDAAFFGVHPKQANTMDPQLRILFEVVYEAVCDSGTNPAEVRGRKIGVFVGTCLSETRAELSHDPETVAGYTLTGCQRSMQANRISYCFGFTGPSFAVDTACSSSLLALQLALASIRNGECEGAIVAGSQLGLLPSSALQFQRLGMLAADGACKTFDANGDGYVRAEGIAAIFLQRESDARRIYATVVHAKSNNDGYKNEGVTYPSGAMQAQLLHEVYAEAGIEASTVSYVECHGTGTKVGDPQEVNAVADFFRPSPNDDSLPLLVGSVKSNMGHAEPASGLASVAKIIISMETGFITPNLHFKEPNPAIPGLRDGRLKVVDEKLPWAGGLVGVNSFGFGGSNVHAILKSGKGTVRAPPTTEDEGPKLVCASGRTQEATEKLLQAVVKHRKNHDFYALASKLSHNPSDTHPFRGFAIFNRTSAGSTPQIEIQKVVSTKRPLWYVYTGMGCQWPGMAVELMGIEVFRDSIRRCSNALLPHGLDLYSTLMAGKAADLTENLLLSAICIIASQIALTDLLRHVGLEPDGFLGHSVGEIACAYADGCFTAEQAVLCAYWRGRVILESRLPPGGMAAVGLSWDETAKRCPPGVVPACNNSADSVTVAGPLDAVDEFVRKLNEEGIFAKRVDSMGQAFHSYFMHSLAEALLASIMKVIPVPKPRSNRWISTSVPAERADSYDAKFSSAAYHVNNATSPVLFHQGIQKIPEDAIVVEVAPHALLQAILRRALKPTCTSIGLLKAHQKDGLEFFLGNLGKLYEAGAPIKVEKLYPKASFPVPRGTPMIGPYIGWDHSDDWYTVTAADRLSSGTKAACSFVVDSTAADSPDKYLLDHVIDGRPLFPLTGYIVLVWRAFAKMLGLDHEKTSIVVENFVVHRATVLNREAKFDISILTASGHFVVTESNVLVAEGTIHLADGDGMRIESVRVSTNAEEPFTLNASDVYKAFLLRGYDYGREFRSIRASTMRGEQTLIDWKNNWIAFADAMIQTRLLDDHASTLLLPLRIAYMKIDPEKHLKSVETMADGVNVVRAHTSVSMNGCIAGGIEFMDLTLQTVPRRQAGTSHVTLEKAVFIPYEDNDCFRDYPELNEDLLEYNCFIQQYSRQILKNLRANGENGHTSISEEGDLVDIENSDTTIDVNEQLKGYTTDDRCRIVHLLQKLVDQSKNPLSQAEITTSLDADFLWSSGWHPRSAKPLLDLVLENSTSTSIRCCALEPRTTKVASVCKSLLEAQPLVESDWVLLSSSIDIDADESFAKQPFDLESSKTLPDGCRNFDLVVADRVLDRKADAAGYLLRLKELLRDDGFALINETIDNFEAAFVLNFGEKRFLLHHDELVKLFKEAGFHVVGWQSSTGLMTRLYLVRKIASTPSRPLFVHIEDESFGWVTHLQDLLQNGHLAKDDTVWVVSNKRDAGVHGFALCLKKEIAKNRIRVLADMSLSPDEARLSVERNDVRAIVEKDLFANVYRDGVWGTIRHIQFEDTYLPMKTTAHANMNTLVRGDMNSLRWFESSNLYWNEREKPQNYKIYSVYYSALNFRDVMLASGRLPDDAIPVDKNLPDRHCLLGLEFSGREPETGKRVMGMCGAQALATTVVADSRFVWSVPDAWNLESAATVPVAYSTAYYALVVRGQLERGESVLIHSAAGGVGIAAVAIALSYDADVFVTCSSEEKRAFLKARFPQLAESRFANSRSLDFYAHVMRETGGRGVDLVLNSLSEEKLQASVKCLARNGRFLEIGKFDLNNNAQLGMAAFLKNISFCGILLEDVMSADSRHWRRVVELVEEGIAKGVVQPLPTTAFEQERVGEAFHYMGQGKHIGKVVLKIRAEESTKLLVPAANFRVEAVCRSYCHPRHVYVITGGLGGFGLELADWLISRGARKIVLTSRSGVQTGYQKRLLYFWGQRGVDVHVSRRDASHEHDAELLIEESKALGPIGGIFHLAVVMVDGAFENQSIDNFRASARTKFDALVNLDRETRKHCAEELQWFVTFSSFVAGRGNAGQTPYGWSNSAMEQIVHQRKRDNLPGIAIQWGAIGDTGVFFDTIGDNSTVFGGILPQRMNSCLATLDVLLSSGQSVVSSFVRAEMTRKQQGKKSDVVQTIAQIIGVNDVSRVDHTINFGNMGLDSLVGSEIQRTLERDFDIVLSTKDVRTLTFDKLVALVAGCKASGAANSTIPN